MIEICRQVWLLEFMKKLVLLYLLDGRRDNEDYENEKEINSFESSQ